MVVSVCISVNVFLGVSVSATVCVSVCVSVWVSVGVSVCVSVDKTTKLLETSENRGLNLTTVAHFDFENDDSYTLVIQSQSICLRS